MTINGTNLSMTRGDSESITVSFVNYELCRGDTVTMTVRRSVYDEIVLQKAVTEFPDERRAVIGIESGDTEGLDFGRYVYDIELRRADGAVTTIIKPSGFTLEKEVTYR